MLVFIFCLAQVDIVESAGFDLSFSEIHRRHPEKTSGPKVPKGFLQVDPWSLTPRKQLGGGMIFIGVPGLRSGGWRNQDFGWNLATFGYMWLHLATMVRLAPTYFRSMLSFFENLCFCFGAFSLLVFGPLGATLMVWSRTSIALELTIWQRLLGKYSWGLPLRNSDCDVISRWCPLDS